MNINDVIDIVRRVHDAEGMDFGSRSTRESRNAHWARLIGIVHWGHPIYHPTPDPQWHIKSAGGGRPQSDDVVVSMPSRQYWDCITSAGADGYSLRATAGGRLSSDQHVYAPPRPDGAGVPSPHPAPQPQPQPGQPPAPPSTRGGVRGDRLRPGEWLEPGEWLQSANRAFTLTYQADSNAVVYRWDALPIWSSDTHGQDAGSLVLQDEHGVSQLLMYTRAGHLIASFGQQWPSGTQVVLQNDGNLVAYHPSETSPGTADPLPIWATNSAQSEWPEPPAQPDQPGPSPGGHGNPLRGYLKSTDRGWTHDGGKPCAPVGLMCGDGLMAKGEGKDILHGILKPAAAVGAQFTMPWSPLIWHPSNNRFWGNRTFGPRSVPNFWQHVREWVLWSRDLEMKTFLAHGGLGGATNAEEDECVGGLLELIQEVGPEWIIFPFMGNEIRDTGDRDDLDPMEHARHLRRIHQRFPDVPLSMGTWTGDPERTDVQRLFDALRSAAPNSQHIAFHAHRHGNWVQKLRRMFNCMFETYAGIAPCGINDENVGPQGRNQHLSEMHNPHEMDRHFMCGVSAISVLTRTLVSFTSSPSVIFDEPFEEIPGWREFFAFAREIPVDAVTYPHALHSGDRAGSRRIFRAQGDIRIDGRIADDGRFCFLAYGEGWTSELTLDKGAEFELVNTDFQVFKFRLARNQRIPSVPVNRLYLLRGQQI